MAENIRVLVLDDEPNLRALMGELLEFNGYDPFPVATGSQAVEAAASQVFPVALIDLELEDMTGLEAMRRIKEHSHDTECIMVTGHASQESAIEAAAMGAYSYLLKPFDMAQLLLTVQRAAEKSETRKALRQSESKYRRLHSSMRDAFGLVDMRGRLLEWNETYRQLLGYSDEELGRLTYQELTPAQWHPIEAKIVEEQIIPLGYSEVYEKEYRRKDGVVIPVELRTFLLRGEAGQPVGIGAVVRDITERKHLERNLLRAHDELHKSNDLLAAISRTQSRLIGEETPEKIFSGMLDDLLKLTASEFGFMGEVLQTQDGQPYLKTHALTDISWNQETETFYREHAPQGLEFFNLDTLFGVVLKTGQALISNDPSTDSRRGGLPDGHPPLRSFLGAPLSSQGRMVGMVGLADRAGGYDNDLVAFLEPILASCAEIIESIRNTAVRRQAEEDLKRARREWEEIFNSIGQLSVVLAPDQRILAVNRAAEEFLGQPQEKIVGQFCYNVFHDATASPPDCPFRMMLQTKSVDVIGTEVKALDRYFLVSCTPVLDQNGSIAKAIHVATDITALKRAEAALRESQDRTTFLSDLLEHSSQPFATTNPDGSIGLCNDAYLRLTGYDKEEIGNITWSTDLTPPEWRQIEEEHLEKLRLTGEPVRYQKEYIRKDGTRVPIELIVHLRAGNHDQPYYYFSFYNDITERKRTETLFRLRILLLEFAVFHDLESLAIKTLDEIGFLTQSPMGFFHFVESDQVHLSLQAWSTRTTKEFCKALPKDTHYPIDQAGVWVDCFYQKKPVIHNDYKGLPHKKGIPPGHVALERELLVPIIKSRQIVAIIGIGNKPTDYTEQDIEAVSYIGDVVWDIMEQKRGEQEKSKLHDQLRQAQKMESIGRLAGGVAHDFNNMLTVILGYTEIALATLNPRDPLFSDIQEIQKAGLRSADLTSQLLAFARKQTVAPIPLDLNAHLENNLKFFKRLLGEEIQIEMIPNPGLWQIRIDRSQLDQILANFAVNSRDAISGIGKIIIETDNVVLSDDYCAAHIGCKPGEYVKLSFADTGCGMDKETQAQVFEPFFTTKEKGKGTGLGLSTVYGIVKQNDGYIDLVSEPGRGTSFIVYIPRYSGDSIVLEPAGPQSTLRGSETVLLVDDEEQVLRFCQKALTIKGYKIITATSPGEALLLAERHDGDIHLLLTDVVMPDMNGVELKTRIETMRPHIKVLYMSGYPSDVITGRLVFEKGVQIVQKPISPTELAVKVRDVLDQ